MPLVTAAVVHHPGGPWSLETLELDEPHSNEALIRITAVGVCHTDLSIRDQYLPLRLPIVLGHEGAGVVERVGSDVTDLAAGDHVVLCPMSCGQCNNCRDGLQVYCDDFLRLNIGGRRHDGSPTFRSDSPKVAGAFFGQSSFATHVLAHRRSVVRVPRDLPLELLGPLGCGIQTGAGAVMNVLRPRAGGSLAVFGVGAVGLSAIMAAHLAGCAPIVAVDVLPSRLEMALELGATHAVDNSRADAEEAVRAACGGRRVSCSIDTTAHPRVLRQAVESLATPGVCISLGLARAGAEMTQDINHLGNGRTIRGVTEGESVPEVMIPALIELWRAGRFPFDRLIRKYPWADINQAAADLQSGAAIKPVLVMP